jgi:hypothetical protein
MADWYRPELRVTKLAPRSVEHSEVRLRMGDDLRWAASDWNDSEWDQIDRTRLPLNAGIFWLRVRVRTTVEHERIPALVMLAGVSAAEVFWDGVQVHTAGTPGHNRERKKVGVSESRFELPASATAAGEHVLALRISTFGPGKVGHRFARLFLVTIDPEDFRVLDGNLRMLAPMGVGAMLTIAIISGLMWVFADRRFILLLFSAFCVSAAFMVFVGAAPFTWTFPNDWMYLQSALRLGMTVVVAGLLSVVTIVQLHPHSRRIWLALPFMVGAAAIYYGLPSGPLPLLANLWRMAFAAVLGLAAFAAWRRDEGAWYVIGGTVVTFALFERDPLHVDNTGFLLIFLPVLTCLIAAIALRVRSERREARDVKLTAARLEIELLKKSLQPHFLMNTLTALSQVIEEKPAAAVRLIDDLAAEFRSLARFSGEKRVSMSEELALCRAHLGVMSARTDVAWSLAAEGVDPRASVPPALFLTLIENGFSHQRPRRDSTIFRLREEATDDGLRYTFLSPGVITNETHRAAGGTGLRYVRARLEESFHDNWKLSQRAVADGWETVIDLPCPRQNAASS